MRDTVVYYPKKSKAVRCVLIWIAVLAVIVVPRITEQAVGITGYELVEVIDGDTIAVVRDKEIIRVRLIGVDAPESVHPDVEQNTQQGVLASKYLKKMLADVTVVYLELDQEEYDAYGRLLAYVYPAEGALFKESLNYRLVEEGYAVNKEYPPNVRYAQELEAACKDAREQMKGLWESDEIGSSYDKEKLENLYSLISMQCIVGGAGI